MNHEAEHHGGIAIGTRGSDLVEALLETGTQVEASEESLKQDQAGEGGELLVFEADLWETARFTFYLSSAKLHGGRPPRVSNDFFGENDSNPDEPPFHLFFLQIATASNLTCGETQARPKKLTERRSRWAFLMSNGFPNATGG